jgi:hypothetical protein
MGRSPFGVTAAFSGRLFENAESLDTSDSDYVEGSGGVFWLGLLPVGPVEGTDLSLLVTRHEIFLEDIPEDLSSEDLSTTDGEGETAYSEMTAEWRMRALRSHLQAVVRGGYRRFDEARTRYLVAEDLTGFDWTFLLQYRHTERFHVTLGYGHLEDLVVRLPEADASDLLDEYSTLLPDLETMERLTLDATVYF